MMEIVHDLAPGAQLFFATAFTSPESFADNIRTLRFVYGCDIIVDDVSYSDEGVFQDGPIAQAVNDVTASGALYFSSAGNNGNITNGTSGTWEGDFNRRPPSAAPLPAGYTLHMFSGAQAFNLLTTVAGVVDLQWSDPFGGSVNDYDLFLLNAAGTAVICASTDVQNGTEDPLEEMFQPAGISGQQPDRRRQEGRRRGTRTACGYLLRRQPAVRSPPAGPPLATTPASTPSGTAATYWNSAHTGTRPFVGRRRESDGGLQLGRSEEDLLQSERHCDYSRQRPVRHQWRHDTGEAGHRGRRRGRRPRRRASCRSSARPRPHRTPRRSPRWSSRRGRTTRTPRS